MSMKYGMSIAVIVIVAAIGVYLYAHRGTVQHSADAVLIVGTVTVTVNENGFSPNTITIKNHTQVVFKNIGTGSHWPASDIHPTHGIYPEFDPQRPVVAGDSWSFVFTRIGAWRMHDHLMPSHLGTITVTQ